jgi:hypothetical protein
MGKANDSTQRAAIKAFILQFNIGPRSDQNRVSRQGRFQRCECDRPECARRDRGQGRGGDDQLGLVGHGHGRRALSRVPGVRDRPRKEQTSPVRMLINITDGMMVVAKWARSTPSAPRALAFAPRGSWRSQARARRPARAVECSAPLTGKLVARRKTVTATVCLSVCLSVCLPACLPPTIDKQPRLVLRL